jgi:hypothetical protein
MPYRRSFSMNIGRAGDSPHNSRLLLQAFRSANSFSVRSQMPRGCSFSQQFQEHLRRWANAAGQLHDEPVAIAVDRHPG